MSERDKDWWMRRAAAEGDHVIGAGVSDDPRCPKCQGMSGVILRAAISGVVTRFVLWNGDVDDTNFDNTRERNVKTGECADCGKRVPIPEGYR